MFCKYKLLLGFLAIFNSVILYAGTMGPLPSFAGLSLGVGGGYSNTNSTEQTVISMISSFPTVTQHLTQEQFSNSFSPVVNASYLVGLENNWLLGVKGVYKYLAVRHAHFTWNGTFQDGTFQSAEVHKKHEQEVFAMLDAGYQLYPHWLVYLGIGPSLTGVTTELLGQTLEPTASAFQFTQVNGRENLWGVAGQVGFEYLLPHRFAIDLSYNLVVTPTSNLSPLVFTAGSSGFYTTFAQRIQLLEQGLNVTINKYFF